MEWKVVTILTRRCLFSEGAVRFNEYGISFNYILRKYLVDGILTLGSLVLARVLIGKNNR